VPGCWKRPLRHPGEVLSGFEFKKKNNVQWENLTKTASGNFSKGQKKEVRRLQGLSSTTSRALKGHKNLNCTRQTLKLAGKNPQTVGKRRDMKGKKCSRPVGKKLIEITRPLFFRWGKAQSACPPFRGKRDCFQQTRK